MKVTGGDPEYERYRGAHPSFPGVPTAVALLHRPNVQGAYLDAVLRDLTDHAATAGTAELVAAFRSEADARVQALLLAAIAQTPSPADVGLFAAVLSGAVDDLHPWAALGLDRLGTPEARQALWQARSRSFADEAAAARFGALLDGIQRSK